MLTILSTELDREKSEAIRSHKDLVKDQAPFFQKATQFYESLAHQLVLQGHTLDVFACALDQVVSVLSFSLSLVDLPTD